MFEGIFMIMIMIMMMMMIMIMIMMMTRRRRRRMRMRMMMIMVMMMMMMMMKAMIMEMRMLSHKTQCVFNVRTRGGRRRGQKEGFACTTTICLWLSLLSWLRWWLVLLLLLSLLCIVIIIPYNHHLWVLDLFQGHASLGGRGTSRPRWLCARALWSGGVFQKKKTQNVGGKSQKMRLKLRKIGTCWF